MDFPLQILKTVGALVLVLGLLWGATFALRRWGRPLLKGSGKGWIHILERRYLGPKHSLVLVRIADETLLLGMSPHGLNYLTTIGFENSPHEGDVTTKDDNP
ncbi:flagellar biosynthetic protein FliO [Desulfosoma caldarium]|uniref:Flagellar protein n=1 Tax=Desulfosoma caldarium TaxID=610254 RepID=A0A3N1VG92_9BACT|nr:flagellar biosynthetic protein FliO [Desulfosoma caldarium]ROR01883.1 flagellar biosynthetic protein FliO [Desulfosoma caldarium]